MLEKFIWKNLILGHFLTMKKESKNNRKSIVKTTKNSNFDQSNSLIEVSAIVSERDSPRQRQGPSLDHPGGFQRFRRRRGSDKQDQAASNFELSARSEPKMARASPKLGERRRGRRPRAPSKHPFDALKFDDRI